MNALIEICVPYSPWCAFTNLALLPYLFFAYLIGSIPFGLLLTSLFGKGDIRKIGSGNIGATNVLRTGSKPLAVATLLLDFLKSVVPVVTTSLLIRTDTDLHDLYLIIGFFAILGHCFPVWLKFKGGKGVATTFGVLFAAVPWAGFIAAVTWGIVAGFTRYSSLAALCAVSIAPVVTLIYYGPMPAGVTVLFAVLVIWRHKDNIKRLMDGTESKILQPKDTGGES